VTTDDASDRDDDDPVELVHDAIEALSDTTEAEREALHELLGNVGSDGWEGAVRTLEEAAALAREQLERLRDTSRPA